jgi:hypothetical protein
MLKATAAAGLLVIAALAALPVSAATAGDLGPHQIVLRVYTDYV